MDRALFVCINGHIFRSQVALKKGRLRQCQECAAIVEDSCKVPSMKQARLHVKFRVAKPQVQVFRNGKIERLRKYTGRKPNQVNAYS